MKSINKTSGISYIGTHHDSMKTSEDFEAKKFRRRQLWARITFCNVARKLYLRYRVSTESNLDRFKGTGGKRINRARLISYLLLITLSVIYLGSLRSTVRDFDPSSTHRESGPELLIYHNSYDKYLSQAGRVHELGIEGQAAKLTDISEIVASWELKKRNSLNELLSNHIALNRSLLDVRPLACRQAIYDTELPTASIVIVITNEPLSVVVRLVWSIINRSPLLLINEIILYNDHGTKEELKQPLANYIHHHFSFITTVKIMRGTGKKLGLLKARTVASAKMATGDVLIFLNALTEVTDGWLEPLLQRIKDNPSAVVSPIIDSIDEWEFKYTPKVKIMRGGFTWELEYEEIPLPNASKSETNFIKSPTIEGFVFAINKEYFWQLGALDLGMTIGPNDANLELSFRVWQCGGSLEYVPCSHVGVIKQTLDPERALGDDIKNFKTVNKLRVAQVWMDNYIRLLYLFDPSKKSFKYGDIRDRKKLRKDLGCQSFKWYLHNIFPEKHVPDENVLAYGRIKGKGTELCFDMLGKYIKQIAALSIYTCQSSSPQEFFSLSASGELSIDESCIHFNASMKKAILVKPCTSGSSDKWEHLGKNTPIKHISTGKCIDRGDKVAGENLFLEDCLKDSQSQMWTFDNYAV